MKKNRLYLQKRRVVKAACNLDDKLLFDSDESIKDNYSNDVFKQSSTAKTYESCENCETLKTNMLANDEVYFEILGFEQSSAVQIISSYAKECNVELDCGYLASSSSQDDMNFANQGNLLSAPLSALPQEYGIVARGLEQNLETFFDILESLFSGRLVRGDIPTLLIQRMQQKNQSLCVAESCTGGVLSSMITSVVGASSVFKGGITSYSVESKQHILGVKDSVIKDSGVYSEACVRAMARGVLDLFHADIAIATSGLATKDESDYNFLNLPAGIVFTCVLIKDRLPISISCNYLSHTHNLKLKDSRVFVQRAASMQSLRLLLGLLLG